MASQPAIAKTSPTPGPWAYEPETGTIYYDDDAGVRPTIAEVSLEGVSPQQALADGLLMAAARDFLAAAKLLMRAGDEGDADMGMDAHDALRAAIAKAEASQ